MDGKNGKDGKGGLERRMRVLNMSICLVAFSGCIFFLVFYMLYKPLEGLSLLLQEFSPL